MRRPSAVVVIAVAIAGAIPATAQSVEGGVIDDGTGEPVAEALVTLLAPGGRILARVRTDVDGSFRIAAEAAGSYRIRGERAGYAPSTSAAFELAPREVLEVGLRLSAVPLQGETLTIVARRAPPRVANLERHGFYRREERGLGRFLHREDIERQASVSVAQVLGRVSGVQIDVDRRGRQYIYFPRAQGARIRGNGPCLPLLYVDGLRIEYSGGRFGPDVNAAVTPESIEAVELYRGVSEIPSEFNNGEAGCGVILIWTRAGR